MQFFTFLRPPNTETKTGKVEEHMLAIQAAAQIAAARGAVSPPCVSILFGWSLYSVYISCMEYVVVINPDLIHFRVCFFLLRKQPGTPD